MDNLLPKYYLIKKNIIEQINKEELKTDEVIPSERELMEIFGVSRITVRKAIDELASEGFLYKVQGKGTYVKGDTRTTGLSVISSCTTEILRQGFKPSRKVLSSGLEPCSKRRARDLEIEENDTVFHMERIYYADGEPVNYANNYINYKYFPGMEQFNFNNESLYKTLEDHYNVKIVSSKRYIEAVCAYEEVAAHLGVKEGYPLLLFRGVTQANIGNRIVPVEGFTTYYKTEKMKFFIDQVK